MLIFYVVALFLTLELLSFFYSKLFSQLRFLRFSIILGIFLHESAHYIACKLTLAPVKKFRIGWRRGYVVHGKSRIPIIGGLIISLAPLFAGLISLGLVLYYLNNGQQLIAHSLDAARLTNWQEMLKYLKEWMLNLDYSSWQFWLSIFLSLNILASFTPSKKDYTNIFWGIILYVAVSYYFAFFDKINLILIYILSSANIVLVITIFFLVILNLVKKVLKFL